jgi:hypothetical protein
MQYSKRGRWFDFTMLPVLILGLVAGVVLDRVLPIGLTLWGGQPNFQLMSEASYLIQRFYVDRPAEKSPTLTYGAISGMVDALGDSGHSRFLSPVMVKEMAEMQRNKYQGIGAEVQSKGGHIPNRSSGFALEPVPYALRDRAACIPRALLPHKIEVAATGPPLTYCAVSTTV